MLLWINDNIEWIKWVFDGIGVAVPLALVGWWLKRRKKDNIPQSHDGPSSINIPITIHNLGDNLTNRSPEAEKGQFPEAHPSTIRVAGADAKPIRAYFIRGYTPSFKELRALISSHEAWSGQDQITEIVEQDATRLLDKFKTSKIDSSRRYIMFIDLVESEIARHDTEDVLDLIRYVRHLGRDIPLKPIFVFFSAAHDLDSAFGRLRPSESSALKLHFQLEPSEPAAEMRERLKVLHQKVTAEWRDNPKSGDSPL